MEKMQTYNNNNKKKNYKENENESKICFSNKNSLLALICTSIQFKTLTRTI